MGIVDCLEWLLDFYLWQTMAWLKASLLLPDPIVNLCCCVCLAGGEKVFLCKPLHNEVAGNQKKGTKRPL